MKLVYRLVGTQTRVEWGDLVDKLKTRSAGLCKFKSVWVRLPPQQRTNVRLEPQGYVEDNGKRGIWLDDRVVGVAPQELTRWFESISNLKTS